MAGLQLSRGLQLKLADRADDLRGSLAGVRQQVEDLNDVLGSLEPADLLHVVLGNAAAVVLSRQTVLRARLLWILHTKVSGRDSLLSPLTGQDQVLRQLLVEAAVQDLDEHGQVLEGPGTVGRERQHVQRWPDTLLEDPVGQRLCRNG